MPRVAASRASGAKVCAAGTWRTVRLGNFRRPAKGRVKGGRRMDERVRLLVMDFQGGRYTRSQFIRKALRFGVAAAALPGLFEMAGTKLEPPAPQAAAAAASQRTAPVRIP